MPKDAQVMDVVFSDTGDLHGGFYDNNNGLDYHIACSGSNSQLPPLRIVHVTVEMAPIAKARAFHSSLPFTSFPIISFPFITFPFLSFPSIPFPWCFASCLPCHGSLSCQMSDSSVALHSSISSQRAGRRQCRLGVMVCVWHPATTCEHNVTPKEPCAHTCASCKFRN